MAFWLPLGCSEGSGKHPAPSPSRASRSRKWRCPLGAIGCCRGIAGRSFPLLLSHSLVLMAKRSLKWPAWHIATSLFATDSKNATGTMACALGAYLGGLRSMATPSQESGLDTLGVILVTVGGIFWQNLAREETSSKITVCNLVVLLTGHRMPSPRLRSDSPARGRKRKATVLDTSLR